MFSVLLPLPLQASEERLLAAGTSLPIQQTSDQHFRNQRFDDVKASVEQELEESIKALGERHEKTLFLMSKLGFIHIKLEDFKLAEARLLRVYDLRMEIDGDNKPATIEAAHNLAALLYAMNELERALPLQRNVLAFLSATQDNAAPQRLIALNNLAETSRKLGYLGDALRWNKESFELSQAADGEKALSTLSAMNNLAETLFDMGRWSEALALQTKHIALIKQVAGPQHPNTITSLNNLAGTYKQLGRDKDALALFKKSLDLSAKVHGPNHSKTIEAMNNLASTQMDMGYPKEAVALLDEAWDKARIVLGERHEMTLKISANLGNALVKAGQVDQALAYQQAAVTASETMLGEKHSVTLIAKNNLAETLRILGQLDEALRLNSDVLKIQTATLGEFHPDTLVTLNNLALTNSALGRSSESIRLYRQMMQGVEKLRSAGDLAVESRRALFAQWVDGYKALSMLYIAEKRYQDAFTVTELSKARTLIESLTQKHADRSGVLAEAERDQLSQYQSRISRLVDGIAHSNRDIDLQLRLEEEKAEEQRALSRYRKSLEQLHPKYAKLNEVTQLSIANGRKYIPSDAAFISYVLSGPRLGAFVLTRHGKLRAADLGVVPGIERSLETYRRILGSGKSLSELHGEGNTVWGLPDGSYVIAPEKPNQAAKRVTKIDEIPQALANRLIKPLDRFIAHKRHWIISPDGALALVPFEALPWAGRRVVERHDVSYVQSLSVLGLIQQRAREYAVKTSRKQLFAMGDPIYVATAQASTEPQRNTLIGSSGASSLLGRTWSQLPGTGKELEYVENTFGKSSSTVLSQGAATEANLLEWSRSQRLSGYRYLLFSAHGYLNSVNPALSALVLGQTSLQEGTDGYVTASEWPAYDLQSDLIVLSACETGLGRVVGGEGVLGLPYALYVAGNRNTLLSLWPILDDSTAEFIKDLFARLKAGVPQVRAVAETKRQFIKRNRGQYANPIYWAPFVLYGV